MGAYFKSEVRKRDDKKGMGRKEIERERKGNG